MSLHAQGEFMPYSKLFIIFLSAIITTSGFAKVEKAKLIVVISIDQFRADYLQKFSSSFLPATQGNKIGGFNYLMTKGAYFSHAQYGILQNMTGPGHATILTGSYPYQNGIGNNDWYDAETQNFVYCTEDQSQKTVGANPSNIHVGTSPKNLIGTTFGDELKNAFPNSRVIAISLKDRAAILMGGHRADIALWFDLESFQWVSSEYYLTSKGLPDWVLEKNLQMKKMVGLQQTWENKNAKNLSDNSNVVDSSATKDMGKTFPHKAKIGGPSSLLFPIAVDMPEEMAMKAIEVLKLGQTKATDVLAISFSNHDYVGHNFGPESEEIKETTIHEDKTIAHFLNFLDKKTPGGLKNIWVILTADHGVSDNPKILAANKIPSGIIDQEAMLIALEKFLTNKYGKAPNKWMVGVSELNFYLNRKEIREHNLDLATIQKEAAKYLTSTSEYKKGIAQIFSADDVKNHTLPAEQFERQILRTYFEGRSGDIVMIPKPNYVISYATTTHLTGHSYDRYVPMIFLGKPFRAGLYASGFVVDIAPTLSFLMGIIPPTNSEGAILDFALNIN